MTAAGPRLRRRRSSSATPCDRAASARAGAARRHRPDARGPRRARPAWSLVGAVLAAVVARPCAAAGRRRRGGRAGGAWHRRRRPARGRAPCGGRCPRWSTCSLLASTAGVSPARSPTRSSPAPRRRPGRPRPARRRRRRRRPVGRAPTPSLDRLDAARRPGPGAGPGARRPPPLRRAARSPPWSASSLELRLDRRRQAEQDARRVPSGSSARSSPACSRPSPCSPSSPSSPRPSRRCPPDPTPTLGGHPMLRTLVSLQVARPHRPPTASAAAARRRPRPVHRRVRPRAPRRGRRRPAARGLGHQDRQGHPAAQLGHRPGARPGAVTGRGAGDEARGQASVELALLLPVVAPARCSPSSRSGSLARDVVLVTHAAREAARAAATDPTPSAARAAALAVQRPRPRPAGRAATVTGAATPGSRVRVEVAYRAPTASRSSARCSPTARSAPRRRCGWRSRP